MKVFSPIDLREVGDVLITTPEDVSKIIDSCRTAQIEWDAKNKKDKRKQLQKLLHILIDRSDDIAHTVYLETGKPRLEGLNTEVMASGASCQYCQDWLKNLSDREQVHQGPMHILFRYLGRRSYIHYRPLGVVGVIAPFNFPFSIPFTQTVMAVTAGNGVVIKPSKETSMTGELIAELFREAGFPEGLVQSITGPNVGDALARSAVDKVFFTGSVDVGRKIIESSSNRLTPVVLELGGKDAMVIREDADLDRASSAAVWGSFVNSGQVCVGVKRIYVHESIEQDFIDMMVEKTSILRQGDGWNDADISLGPMINEKALQEMERQVRIALEQGGRLLIGGSRNLDLKGYFFKPTIISVLNEKSDLIRNETFGPIVAVSSYSDDEKVIQLVNDSDFALSGSVWTKDLRKGKEMAERFLCGTAVLNNLVYTYGLPATPWGGRKESGYGRTHGIWGFQELMEPHHIHIDKGGWPREFWWFPYSLQKQKAQLFFMDFFFRAKKKGLLKGIRNIRKIMKGA